MIALSDLWLGDVRAAGDVDPIVVRAFAAVIRGHQHAKMPPLQIIVGEDGGVYAVGGGAAEYLAALREVYAGTTERLDRLERLGRVRVLDETDLRRLLDEELPAGQDPQTWTKAGEVIRGALADLDEVRAAKREEEGR